MQIVERLARGKMPLVPSGGTTVVDVRDVAEGCVRALERGETGERYVLAGDDLAWSDIAGTLAKAFGAAPPRATMPPRLAMLLGTLAELGARVVGKEAAFTREAARLSSRTQHYSSRRAQRDLGMDFRPFGETARWIADTVRFG
jgi:dihydroflavonol-4-reductase